MCKQEKSIFIGILVIISLFLFTTLGYSDVLKGYKKKIRNEGIKVKVIKVLTPTKLVVKENENEFEVHLLNTYSPPENSPIYKKSIERCKKYVLNKYVYLFYDKVKTSDSGQALALVYYADIKYLLNATMIYRGYAYYENTYPCWLNKELTKLQDRSIKRNYGLWKYYSDFNELKEETGNFTKTVENIDKIEEIETLEEIDIDKLSEEELNNITDNITIREKLKNYIDEDYPDDLKYIEIEELEEEFEYYNLIEDNDNDIEKGRGDPIVEEKNNKWISYIFSLNIKELEILNTPLAKHEINIYELLKEKVFPILNINIEGLSDYIYGFSSDENINNTSSMLIFIHGDFSSELDKIIPDNKENYSIYINNSELIVIGINKGIDLYIEESADNENNYKKIFNNIITNSDFVDNIKNLNIEIDSNSNWLYISPEAVKNKLIKEEDPIYKNIQGIGLSLNFNDDVHTVDFSISVDDKLILPKLESMMSGYITFAKTLNTSLNNVLQDVQYTYNNNTINIGFSITNDNLINIDEEFMSFVKKMLLSDDDINE